MNRWNPLIARWTVSGVIFGLLLPILTTIVDMWLHDLPFSLVSAVLVQQTNPIHWIVDTAPFVVGTAFYLIGLRDAALQGVRDDLQQTLRQMETIKAKLEQRIDEHHSQIEQIQADHERRAHRFVIITLMAEALQNVHSLDEALTLTVQELCTQFGYPYAAIYLLDESRLHAGRYAIHHGILLPVQRIRVSDHALLEWVVLSRTPRTLRRPDYGTPQFHQPISEEINTQLLLPIQTGDRIVAILDLQSPDHQAFSAEEMPPLAILADLLGSVIQNLRMLERARVSLEEFARLEQRNLSQVWTEAVREERLFGYRYVNGTSIPLEAPLPFDPAAQQVLQSGLPRSYEPGTEAGTAHLDVPIRIRGASIGLLRISAPRKRWSNDDIDIVEVVAERLALALENALLIRSSLRRAERERIISAIASRISGQNRIRTILQTAAQELSQALNGGEVLIQLQPVRQVMEEVER